MDDEQNEDTEEIIQVNIVLLHSSLIIHNFPYTFDIGSISQKELQVSNVCIGGNNTNEIRNSCKKRTISTR